MSREQTKAIRYVQLLDEARCSANWTEVPELVRKVRKHAPKRECLALTAETEHDVTQITQSRTASSHGVASGSLTKYIPSLRAAIDKEDTYVEDKFQAIACLAWIHWNVGDYVAAATCFSGSIEQDFARLDGSNKDSADWTRVCALRSIYVKGASLEKVDSHAAALTVFESGLPVLASVPTTLVGGAELKLWTELYLTQFCMVSSRAMKTRPNAWQESELLTAFRAWDTFWTQNANQPSLTGGYTHQASVSRRHVWKDYYVVLSTILRQNLPYPTTSLSITHVDSMTRRHQYAELKRVQIGYESLMLKEVSFPRADQASSEVEEWTDHVVQNWESLSSWSVEDLGEDHFKLGRNVLDILYRAATKSFHSTPILRYLFTVHLALADFDLAFKAFDTYLEIVRKGKARLEKTGEVEDSLDDDNTILLTVSVATRALCRFGRYAEAVKAKSLAQSLRDWLSKYPDGDGLENGSRADLGASHPVSSIASTTRAMTWGAIGIAEAHWARCTFEATARSDIQLEAIRCLGKALSKEYGHSANTEHLFSLALLFAERRELNPALEVVKAALLPSTVRDGDGEREGQADRYARERSLITSWHLLALLLSAKQELTTASQAAEGAFEQFKAANLFGDESFSTLRSEHLRDAEKMPSRSARGLVAEMNDFEKEALLEVKMTQLALLEINEGPDQAVNQSDELLSLYARLFRDNAAQIPQITRLKPTIIRPPTSSSSKAHSIKGALFGRKSVRQHNGPPISGTSGHMTALGSSTTLASTTSRAPTIHVTDVGSDHETHRRHRVLQKGTGSLSGRHRAPSSVRDQSSGVAHNGFAERSEISPGATSAQTSNHADHTHGDSAQIGLAVDDDPDSHSRTIRGEAHQNMQQQGPTLRPLTADRQQDTRLPRSEGTSSSSGTTTRFAQHEQHRRRLAILVKVWLMIAGFYRRAEMTEDAGASIMEAEKIVQMLQHQVEVEEIGDTPIDVVGWGQRKSVEELWADVLSERGKLAASQSSFHIAIGHYEQALIHYSDHPMAVVGLSNLLLDIYTEELSPMSHIPALQTSVSNGTSTPAMESERREKDSTESTDVPAVLLQTTPLGQPCPVLGPKLRNQQPKLRQAEQSPLNPRSTSSTEYMDRLACRDRAYGLLSGLTKMGTGWSNSEAWFALARAYELSGQADKERNALWWCVELEEGRAVRNWDVLNSGGYAL